MRAYKLTNGHLQIPRSAEGPDGLIGDGMIEIGPEDPEYQKWLPYAEEKVSPKPSSTSSQTPESMPRRTS
jgi:hypothetical protein